MGNLSDRGGLYHVTGTAFKGNLVAVDRSD